MQLTATFSDALIDLIRAGDAPIDAIEVGPWYSVRQIRQAQTLLPGWRFHFHAGNIITQIGPVPGTIRRLQAYLQCTQGLWASCHLTLLRPGYVWLALRFGLYLPPPNVAKATGRFVRRVAELAHMVGEPVILENMPAPPDRKQRYAFEADAGLINEILLETGCNMLLDLSHARVAASGRGIDIHEYLESLPLAKVVQIHVSGPRTQDGFLRDAHEPLQDVDYALLEWTLARTTPQVVTLEYFRDRAPLRQQLVRLRNMVPA